MPELRPAWIVSWLLPNPHTSTIPGAPHTWSCVCDPRHSASTLRRRSNTSGGGRCCAPFSTSIPGPRSAPKPKNREVNIYTPVGGVGGGCTWITRSMVTRQSEFSSHVGPQRFRVFAGAWVIEQIMDCLRPPIPYDLICGLRHGATPSRDFDDHQGPPCARQRSSLPIR